ncbi:hypothetical protein KX729_07030 [Rhizobium sp. XQZ8]|uniref:hypothetical protein n=1 Tax=Rhizobium populisoli TaxID=2859785 RepID=UPI001CA4CAC9|nr:hypothetical protein [Rhizobium populisoli]MBW6421192.1 hypothetical protein [Rhizobium populisoli]
MRLFLVVLSLIFAGPAAVHAADWKPFANARFGYTIDMPPGFAMQRAPDNGDGGTFLGKDGTRILVFGTHVLDTTFDGEASNRIVGAMDDGWEISYSRVEPEWASYSGAKGDRILYVRGIKLCDDSAGFLMLEYSKQDLKLYDPIVKRMVKSFKPAGCPR